MNSGRSVFEGEHVERRRLDKVRNGKSKGTLLYCVTSGCLLLLAFCTYSVTAGVLPRVKRSYDSGVSNESPLMFEGPILFPVGNSKGYKLICSANPDTVNFSDVLSISWVVQTAYGPEVRINESSTKRITIDAVKNAEEYKNTLIIKNLELETYWCEILTKTKNGYLADWYSFRFDDCDLRCTGLEINGSRLTAVHPSLPALPAPPVRPAPSKNPLVIDVIQPNSKSYVFKLVCSVDPTLIDSSNIKRLSWVRVEDDGSLVEITESSKKIKLDAETNGGYKKTLIIDNLPLEESVFTCQLETESNYYTYLTQYRIFNQ